MSAQLYLESGVSYLWLLYKPHIIHLLQTVINPAALQDCPKNVCLAKLSREMSAWKSFDFMDVLMSSNGYPTGEKPTWFFMNEIVTFNCLRLVGQ